MYTSEKFSYWFGIIYDIIITFLFITIIYVGYDGTTNNINMNNNKTKTILAFIFILLFCIPFLKLIGLAFHEDIIKEEGDNSNRYFFIHSYRKYLTVNNENDESGNAKLYDKLRLFTSEFITIITQCLFIGLLVIHYTNIIGIINPASNKSNIIKASSSICLFVLICICVMFYANKSDINNVDNIQMIGTIGILLSMIYYSFDANNLYKVSIPMILVYIIFPRLVVNSKEYCSDRSKNGCAVELQLDNYTDPLKCEWNIDKCVDLGTVSKDTPSSSPESSNDSCDSFKDDETECLNNNCYFIKKSVSEEIPQEGLNKINSITACIPDDEDKCDNYSCNSEFFPLNIFDECCEKQLKRNGCDMSARNNHLEDVDLDELKNSESDIKRMYGQEAWSKKVEYDELYSFCEEGGRRAEIADGIYA